MAAQYVDIVPGNSDNITTWKLRFNLPNSRFSGDVQVKIIDNDGQSDENLKTEKVKTFEVSSAASKIQLSFLKDFRNTTVMKDNAVFNDVEVLQISGGVGGYKIKDGASIGNGTMSFFVKGDKVVVRGTPDSLVNTH